MRTSFVDKDTCSVADLVRISPGEYLITRIKVPVNHLRKGVGTKLLRAILANADANNCTLVLAVAPYYGYGMTIKQLCSWYIKYGFVHRFIPNTMYRESKHEGSN